MDISAFFIRRPIGTSLMALGLFMFGLMAWRALPVAALPEVEFPTIQVSASLPGASPETMASNVATPLERYFSQIAGLTQLTSSSVLGSSNITLQFDLNRSIDSAAIDVAAAINAAGGQLPANLPSPPTYRKVNPADRPILLLGMSSQTLPVTTVSDLADSIVAQQISQLPGVGLVTVFGQQKPAVRVQVDPARAAALGLDLEQVRTQLASATVNSPKGSLDGPAQNVTVYDNDQIFSAAAWNDVLLGYRGGAPIRVRDIGRAIEGPENARSAAWAFSGPGVPADTLANGKSVVVAVFKQPGANVIGTVDGVTRALPRIEAAIPPAVQVGVLSDRTQTIRASVDDVEFTLLLSIALVVMVIFLFLRNVAATLIPAATIPLAILGTAALMHPPGFSLDNLSLMALTIAVGFVVDDAVVVLENIFRHVEAGVPPEQAALQGSREIAFTVVSISVSLVAVFIPLLLMGGVIGRFFREFASTVTFTIAISVVVALTLIPMLCARFLRPRPEGRPAPRILRWSERSFDAMHRGYDRALQTVLRHQPLTLLVFLATMAATVALYVYTPKGFFPQQDTGFIQGQAESSQDSSFEAMSRRALAIADIVRADPDVYGLAFNIGSNAYNSSNFNISLKPRSEGRRSSADQVLARLRRKLARLQGVTLFMQAAQDVSVGGRLARTQYQYTLIDSSIDELGTWAPRILERLRSLPQLADVASDQQLGAAALHLAIDRDRAGSYGITPALIDATLYDAIGQRQVAQYFTQLNAYHVVLEVTPALAQDPNLLHDLYINSPVTGQPVPLATFASFDNTRTNYLSVSHQGQFPAVTISFNLAPGAALGDAVGAVQGTMAAMKVPAALSGNFQGTAQAFQQSLASQPLLIAAALLAVYIVLGLLYESYIHPLTILSTLPSAGLGALLMLLLFGYNLDVIALIAIILLIGIVKKNGIMMVDFALTAEREQGLAPDAAIVQACLRRFRPIMMTTMCALLAGVPLMLGGGIGSELRRPLGFAMVGGLAVSQLLTLFTTPVVYLYLDRLRRRWEGRKPETGPTSGVSLDN
ncbi:efflux RND transporter permease subunit [Ramlibacter tataouinensis]|uniref:efflux RND transporter permease subunit n=1 Tax=Ramlibacter tataouinensis TaxID=94132 RepID=UPI0022F3D390|nr:efflux RND transporter permease subunit [Ramlibacter tataouinensis]WBY02841.1 efflux RND transporter permease subunit [Ramlibacter tataouinensis]